MFYDKYLHRIRVFLLPSIKIRETFNRFLQNSEANASESREICSLCIACIVMHVIYVQSYHSGDILLFEIYYYCNYTREAYNYAMHMDFDLLHIRM